MPPKHDCPLAVCPTICDNGYTEVGDKFNNCIDGSGLSIRKMAKKLRRLSWAYSKNKPSKPLKPLILYLVNYGISQDDNP